MFMLSIYCLKLKQISRPFLMVQVSSELGSQRANRPPRVDCNHLSVEKKSAVSPGRAYKQTPRIVIPLSTVVDKKLFLSSTRQDSS